MASQDDINLAFQRAGKTATSSDYSLYGSNPFFSDSGKVEGDIRAGGGGRTYQDYQANAPLEMAKKLNEFQVQANQPAIQSLQASKAPLEQRYQDLITNIKGNQQTAENRQTVSTKNELARRGIVGGGLYDSELSSALNPVTQGYTNLLSQANTSQGMDEASINNAIAQMQSGNPASAVQSAIGLLGQQQQANQFSQQLGLQQQQQQFQQKYITIPGYGIYDTENKSLVGGMSQTGLSPSGYQVIGQY